MGDSASGSGEGLTIRSPTADQPPAYLRQPVLRARQWLSIAVAVTVAAVAGLIATTWIRSTVSHSSINTAALTHTATTIASAQQRLCAAHELAARAVRVDQNGSDKAFTRAAPTNSAGFRYNASHGPALEEQHRSAVEVPVTSCLTETAKSARETVTEMEFKEVVVEHKRTVSRSEMGAQ